jgi:hypothetical protein
LAGGKAGRGPGQPASILNDKNGNRSGPTKGMTPDTGTGQVAPDEGEADAQKTASKTTRAAAGARPGHPLPGHRSDRPEKQFMVGAGCRLRAGDPVGFLRCIGLCIGFRARMSDWREEALSVTACQ